MRRRMVSTEQKITVNEETQTVKSNRGTASTGEAPKEKKKKGRMVSKGTAKDDDSPSEAPGAGKLNGTEDGEVESLSAPVPRSKTNYETAEGIPRNMTIPDPLVLEKTPKPANSTRIASWNIVSLKSSMGKGLLRYIEAEDADVVLLTETKVSTMRRSKLEQGFRYSDARSLLLSPVQRCAYGRRPDHTVPVSNVGGR